MSGPFRAKPCRFTKYLTPDKEVPSIQVARSSPKVHEQRLVKGAFTWVRPEKRDKYILRWVSPAAKETLGLTDIESDEFAAIVSGEDVVEDERAGLFPYAQNYAGYQFGQWAGQLGDGRAISLFECGRYEIQLKGAGLTPYSRFADGKAVLRSSIREALASEAVNALGIPTTRALALTELPETRARRERTETCAIVTRFAESWVRFGTFELYHMRGDRAGVRALADYCIDELYPEAKTMAKHDKNRYYQFWRLACLRNAKMAAKTQAFGFLNGVLNTDNTSILGLSIDYGPFAFMDTFDFSYTPNHDDGQNRYGFRNAPLMIWWNCVRLGEALGELIGIGDKVDEPEFIEKGTEASMSTRQEIAKLATTLIMDVGEEFENTYKEEYLNTMRERLGLQAKDPSDSNDLVEPLLNLLNDCELDYNMFFRNLGSLDFFSGKPQDSSCLVNTNRASRPLKSSEDCKKDIDNWLVLYAARLEKEKVSDADRKAAMNAVNPRFILRNWVLNDVIAKAQDGDWEPFYAVAEMSISPFQKSYATKYPQYLGEVPDEADRNTVCSCSS